MLTRIRREKREIRLEHLLVLGRNLKGSYDFHIRLALMTEYVQFNLREKYEKY